MSWESVVAGIIIGAVVAIVGALVNYFVTAKRDKQRREYELKILQQGWEREDRTRHHDSRLEAYLRFVQGTRDLPLALMDYLADEPRKQMSEKLFGNYFDVSREVSKSFSEIEIFASNEVVKIAKELSEKASLAAQAAFMERTEFDDEGNISYKDFDPSEASNRWYQELFEEVAQQRMTFIQAVRKELGVDATHPR